MELIDIIPEFNLYEEFWKIYTSSEIIPPQYVSPEAKIERCIVGDGSEIFGEVYNSVIGAGVTIGKGTVVRDSIIMKGASIGENSTVDKGIIAENVVIGDDVQIGVGEEAQNQFKPSVYAFGLATIGEGSVIPSHVKIGKNTAISGETVKEDYPNGLLESGETLIKAGDVA